MFFSLNNGVCISVAMMSLPMVLSKMVREKIKVKKMILSLLVFAREIQVITNFRATSLLCMIAIRWGPRRTQAAMYQDPSSHDTRRTSNRGRSSDISPHLPKFGQWLNVFQPRPKISHPCIDQSRSEAQLRTLPLIPSSTR
jgi:hypothetical protein